MYKHLQTSTNIYKPGLCKLWLFHHFDRWPTAWQYAGRRDIVKRVCMLCMTDIFLYFSDKMSPELTEAPSFLIFPHKLFHNILGWFSPQRGRCPLHNSWHLVPASSDPTWSELSCKQVILEPVHQNGGCGRNCEMVYEKTPWVTSFNKNPNAIALAHPATHASLSM